MLEQNRLEEIKRLAEDTWLAYEAPTSYVNRSRVALLECLAEIERLQKERDAAMKKVPRRCWTCGHSRHNSGNDCELAHYTGASDDCQSWIMHGLEEVAPDGENHDGQQGEKP